MSGAKRGKKPEELCLAYRPNISPNAYLSLSTTVRGIVALFQKMGLNIVLAAPTGRAAKRMSELTGMEAQTVHRLLGMTWNEAAHQVTFQKTEKEPLEAEAVIVDEMSMVDVSLFSALLRALRSGTRLVLVGDADQLPSVGAGNVFSDLIRSKKIETVFLREVFRQAEQSAIIRNAHRVNLGESPELKGEPGGFLLPLPPGRPAGGVHGAGAVPHPPAGQYAHPGGPDPGADPHPKGSLRHHESEPAFAGGPEPQGPRQAGDSVGRAGVPVGTGSCRPGTTTAWCGEKRRTALWAPACSTAT